MSKFQEKKFKKGIKSLIKTLDLGIEDLDVETVEVDPSVLLDDLPDEILPRELRELFVSGEVKERKISTYHKKYDKKNQAVEMQPFEFRHESKGTQKLFALTGPVLDTLAAGKILIVDELDVSLHPLLTRFLIQLFHSKKSNPKNAQLVFTTHDTNLLHRFLFRRDQIWFTEKDRYGATDLYSLAEYKSRPDASFQKDYIQGRYGAIPFLGDIESLFEARDGKG